MVRVCTLEDGARHQIAKLEREAKALGADPAAALLFHQIGLLWEGPLQNARNAAVAYQNAFRLSPKFLANIRAARRLFAEVGNWQMVVQLLDAELAAIADDRDRAGLLFEKAAVLEEHLSRDEEATGVLSECLKLLPRDVSLLVQLESAFTRRSQYPELVQVYRLLAEEVTDEATRAYYLTAAGLILEARLSLPDEAAAAYQAAFKLNRRDPILLAALVRMASRSGDGDELIGALAAQAQVEHSQAASNYIQISRIYGRLGRNAEALSALLDARSSAPEDPIVLSELASIYQEQAMHEDLVGVLLSQADLSQDPTEFAGLNLRLAVLSEEVLKRDDEAVARYRAVLARVPHDPDALAGLGRLYHRTQNWEGLLSAFDLEAEAAQEPREKAARMYKAAELLERQLRREEEAIARYNQCLQLQPGYLPAQQALIRLYERQRRYGDLIAMYEHDIGLTTERDQIISTLNKMATIYEEKLSELDRAIDCMKRILELDPQHVPTIRNMARMLEYAGQWRELIQVQEREASTCTDTKQILSLHHRNAEILEGQLSDKSGAIEAYRQLLSLSPNYLPALKALGRLHTEQGNWQELVAMHRAEAEIASSPDHAAHLLSRAGELIERKLGDSEQAIAVYREALHLSPSCLPALRALEQIYRSRKDWEQLLEVLRSEAAHRSDPRERAHALFQAAGICEAHLNRPDDAIDTYLEVIRLAPGHAAATAALKRLYTAQGNLQEMVAILDGEAKAAETSQAKITAQLKLADLYLDRLDEPRLAAQACQAILALEPANLQALKMLERASAADRSHSSELKLKLAAAVSDSRLRAALHLAALSNGLADEGTIQKLLQQFAETTDARPGMLVEAALRRHGKSEELLAHYQRMAQATADPLEKLGLLFRLADLAEHRAEQPAIALKAYRSALELNPQLVPALQGVARCALQLKDFAAAKEALEAEGNASRDVRSALEAFVAAGRLCAEQLGDSDGAIANFRRALERDPLDPSASAALKDLLSGGKAEDLASFHERSAEAKLAQHELSAAAADFLTAARTWLEKSSDPARALRAVERSLAAQPGHAGALEMKGQLALDAHQFGEAAAAYAARVQLGGVTEELIPIHLKLGALYQDYLSDATRAAVHLQTVLAAHPNNPTALERLATVQINAKNWSGAAESLKALLELEGEPGSRARHSLLLAKVYEEGFSNPALAASLYRRALELAPGDLSVVGRLTELYQRMGNPEELVQVLEQQLQNAGSAQNEAALRVKIGNLYTKSLSRPDQAAANYRLAVERDPTCLEAGVALAELYMHDAAAAPDAIEAHRRVLRLQPTRAESLHALFRLWHGLKQQDRAFCAAALLRFLGFANDAELAHHKIGCSRLERAEPRPLSQGQLNGLCHADAKGPILDVLRAIGDQLAKLYPADFNRLGIQWRTHRLRAEHPAFKTVQATMRLFGVSSYEACRMSGGSVTVEIADPFFVCIPDEVLDKPGREHCTLLGRAAFSMANKTPIVHKLAPSELADLVGAAIRICVPDFSSLGSPREELSRQLLKALSRKARRTLEDGLQVIGPRAGDLEHWLEAWTLSEDRAALIAAADPYAALSVTLGKESNAAAERSGAAPNVAARRRLEELVGFALSEEHFLLREQIGSAL